MLWQGVNFSFNTKSEWICNICGKVANGDRGGLLRTSVRRFHTVARCAAGLQEEPENIHIKALGIAKGYENEIYIFFCFGIAY